MPLAVPLLALLPAAGCRWRPSDGEAGALSRVACGTVVTADLPRPVRRFEITLLPESDGALKVEIACVGESRPWSRTLQPGESAQYACEGAEPRIRKVVLRSLGEHTTGWVTYRARALG